MEKIKLIAPFTLRLAKSEKGKKYSLSMNQFLNYHWGLKSDLKHAYRAIMKPQIENLKLGRVELSFYFYPPSNHRRDRSNFLSIHEKFICDVLVENGCLVDDNDDYIKATHYYTGGIDKENPRVEILIHNHKEALP
jgi:hypothetical protein